MLTTLVPFTITLGNKSSKKSFISGREENEGIVVVGKTKIAQPQCLKYTF